MDSFKIIQGGMGVAISDWRLARTVSLEGQLGVVSGTGIALIMTSRLTEGDIGGHIRRALKHFPCQESVQQILDKYFNKKGAEGRPLYKRPSMWTINPPKILSKMTVIANFVEVFLAKEGHDNPVGINLLEKIQLPTVSSLYGAMLAGVNYVIMGAGTPFQIPGILDKLRTHQPADYRIDVKGATAEDNFRLQFDPRELFSNVAEKLQDLARPYFFPVVSSVVLAQALIKRSTGTIDGLVIEGNVAGGHNAPPRGTMQLDERGEPIYGKKDTVELTKIVKLGLPFWLAGGHDSPEGLEAALAAGASGVQVGTAFAYCNESGMAESLKRRVIQKVIEGDTSVRTDPLISPTGYPFKVVQLEDTMSEGDKLDNRTRFCDIGMLRDLYKLENGKAGYRCASEPVDLYVKKGGQEGNAAGRGCLCNTLCSTAGFPQRQKTGYVEPPLVTSGDGLPGITRFFRPGQSSYSAKDVLDFLTGKRRSEQASARETQVPAGHPGERTP
jgi:nitronate monooxygenase